VTPQAEAARASPAAKAVSRRARMGRMGNLVFVVGETATPWLVRNVAAVTFAFSTDFLVFVVMDGSN
jgi:hypothetical protein